MKKSAHQIWKESKEQNLSKEEFKQKLIENNVIIKTDINFCIKVQANHDCWIADWEGDPGRTLVKENAKLFKTEIEAEKFQSKMALKYPNRKMWIELFT